MSDVTPQKINIDGTVTPEALDAALAYVTAMCELASADDDLGDDDTLERDLRQVVAHQRTTDMVAGLYADIGIPAELVDQVQANLSALAARLTVLGQVCIAAFSLGAANIGAQLEQQGVAPADGAARLVKRILLARAVDTVRTLNTTPPPS